MSPRVVYLPIDSPNTPAQKPLIVESELLDGMAEEAST